MPAFPLPTLAAQVDASGISAPTFAEVFESLQATFKGIYGSDAYISADSKDGQLLAAVAKAISDCNTAAIAVYNNYSPATSQGAGLSTAVKMNGLVRRVAGYSTVDVLVVGTAGTGIVNGIVGDAGGAHQWNLPALVTIPMAGEITATATCADVGAIAAPTASIVKIVTPTRGWQTVSNAAEAIPGAPVESDAQLRRRQSQASGLPSVSALSAVFSGLAGLPAVTEVSIHENYTGIVDAAGTPAHSISVIIIGGDLDQIAAMIALKKSPGCATFGDLDRPIFDANGLPITISFSRPHEIAIDVVINVKPKTGYYSTNVTTAQQAAVTEYIDGLSIGEALVFNRLWVPASLVASAFTGTFQIDSITVNGGTVNVAVAYNEMVVTNSVTVNLI